MKRTEAAKTRDRWLARMEHDKRVKSVARTMKRWREGGPVPQSQTVTVHMPYLVNHATIGREIFRSLKDRKLA